MHAMSRTSETKTPLTLCNAHGSFQVKEDLIMEHRFDSFKNLVAAAFVNCSTESGTASRFKMTSGQLLKGNEEHRRVRVDSGNLARCLEAIHERHA
jgi:hypothetical protein